MDTGKKFQRSFLILTNEDTGYEAGQKPSGHIKLEVREGRGKLHANVQNLRAGNGKFVYKLYLLRTGRDGTAAVCTGQLAPQPNKAELEWSFDPRNVGASGYGIDEFDIVVVLAEYAGRPDDAIICPLAAYKNKKAEWRSGLRAAMLKRRMEVPMVAETVQDTRNAIEPLNNNALPKEVNETNFPDNAVGTAEQNAFGFAAAPWQPAVLPYTQPMQMEFIQMPQKDQLQQAGQKQQAGQQTNQIPQAGQMQKTNQMQQADEMQQADQQTDQIPQASQMQKTNQMQQAGEMQQADQLLPSLETALPQIQSSFEPMSSQVQPPNQQLTQEQLEIQQMQVPETLLKPTQEQPSVQYQDNLGQIDTACVYLNGNICGAFVNNGASTVNPCDACRMHNEHKTAAVQPAADMSQLREEIDRYFEESDPFHSKRSDYLWWKVTNPVNLNNILYQCNIRSPLLFNPAVMMAHYKYRHLIIGIFIHKARQKQYVVCGVPGMHMVDRKPFGEMSRWVQAEGNRPRYGAFGYWLVYIDPDNGKILNISQEL